MSRATRRRAARSRRRCGCASLLEEIELADQVGLDVFGVGEHHRPDYVGLGAGRRAWRGGRAHDASIRLTSAVTVLSSDDPVRVFQQFATVDLLSGGRAEIMAGRGSFIESYPLFGQDLRDYDALFAEKLELLLRGARVRADHLVGRASAGDRRPRRLPASGAAAAADLDRRRRDAGLGRSCRHAGAADGAGDHRRRCPIASRRSCSCIRTAAARAGHDPSDCRWASTRSGLVADTSQRAADTFFRRTTLGDEHRRPRARLGADWPRRVRRDAGPQGALVVGSPQQVVDKILREREIFGRSLPAADEHRRDAAQGGAAGDRAARVPRWRRRCARARL